VRVVIAEDVGLYREMLTQVLLGGGLDVVGAAGTREDALALVRAWSPDVVVLDIRMPPTFTDEGFRTALQIRRQWTDMAVLLLSQYGETEYAERFVHELGHHAGYLLKERTASTAELLAAIHRIATGGVVVDPDVVAQLLHSIPGRDPLTELTPRERETLALMAEGCSNAAIAERLRIAVSTVEKYATGVFRKLTLDDGLADRDNVRVGAVLTYLRRTGQIQSPPASA
jgi:DNA-binding NarL/FixJ family response regulator